ncbi:sugar phosphate nucleotidyltransferase [Bacillus sp. MRMR6]|uniref:sugar phosphate nucleotidyltransferase n=1 Tax=Bacillus sp. MRMR6 TaxID=1928617 RepID=UPI000950C643|nr:sugar phosphate nucleotidyltransferase [Bacillus sp. MRMR6]OLS34077.1 spore coat protein [Bacillus sp. MRMR6]
MKGVILAGGKGTRLEPFTKILNKHLLPVGPNPMIYWPISRLKHAGIKDILIITNQQHLSSFINILGNGEELGVNLSYNIQNENGGGIADALKGAEEFVDDKFIVLLGDNLFDDELLPFIVDFQKGNHQAKVLLKEVMDPERYGVALLDESKNSIISIIEKPKNPISRFCVTGIYFYDKLVFELIDSLHSSYRGEKEITDLNNLYINRNGLSFGILKCWWLDAGTHDALYKANKHFYEKEIETKS